MKTLTIKNHSLTLATVAIATLLGFYAPLALGVISLSTALWAVVFNKSATLYPDALLSLFYNDITLKPEALVFTAFTALYLTVLYHGA
ncbi:hypothetical protein [Candidatus Synchoanobacter obligatus]|uniref:Uncharacterized protein n=1 Tax=Candidatus Synchoanobacter obligatus TaxID=2919597 RepID=A0ABT1L7F4_9GAMM|nr:hypothetical protein [Candidatus Synchoanobacter obligatus]MCP8352530.1 hypothetical protein [Candidatus Synchoanobacter obligatus]